MRSGLESYCRECSVRKSAEYRAANPDRVQAAAARRKPRTTEERWAVGLWVNYRLRPDDYWRMHENQGGCCALCGEPERGKRGMLHVDHDHATGSVRGLLCHHCNVALGHFRDDPDRLQAAIDYLTH